jgi:N-formylglutamate deformylase
MKILPGVLIRQDPVANAAPLLFEIPRSGTWYPCDFQPIGSFEALHRSVSMYVEQLYQGASEHGATWLFALFPNSYIDANRHQTDFAPEQIDGPWDGPLQPTIKTTLGIGLIHSVSGRDRIPLYDGPLRTADVRNRIENYYSPYHQEVARILAQHRQQAGIGYHVSCHSMASIGGASTLDQGAPRSDFDIGDLNGVSCEPGFTDIAVSTLRGFGYRVTTNFHYAGAECVRKHSAPEKGIHSLQIELKRGLYMDEASFNKNDGFAKVKHDLDRLSAVLADYARSRRPLP